MMDDRLKAVLDKHASRIADNRSDRAGRLQMFWQRNPDIQAWAMAMKETFGYGVRVKHFKDAHDQHGKA